MNPLPCLISIKLPRPRTPLPAYMTSPSAAASTGSPDFPAISMPFVLELKLWMILPSAGHAQAITPASLALGGGAVATGPTGLGTGTGAVVTGACGAGGLPLRPQRAPITMLRGAV